MTIRDFRGKKSFVYNNHVQWTPLSIKKHIQEQGEKIHKEFLDGLSFIEPHKKTVSILGSARIPEDSPFYVHARSLAQKISCLGFSVVTGGGPGIMEAGNRGAFEAGCSGLSLGVNIKLPHEQVLNPYTNDSLDFHYFFSRKFILMFGAEAYIYFPGGFGTLDELFEILTLIQTKKIPKNPIILFGSEFWDPMISYFRDILLKNQLISPEDMDLFTLCDTEDEVLKILTVI